MQILLNSINYSPDETGIALYNTEMCEFLTENGHDVTVCTGFSYYPEWKKKNGDRKKVYRKENLNGVMIKRSYLFVPKGKNAILRLLHEMSFVVSSFFTMLFEKKPDFYIFVGPPIFSGLSAILISFIKRRPFIFHVQDLQPDVAIELGLIRGKFLIKTLLILELLVYKCAKVVTTISNNMRKKIISKNIPSNKVILFPNWANIKNIKPGERNNFFRDKYKFSEECKIVLYSGNIGYKQDFNTIISAAKVLEKRSEILFLVVGDGNYKNQLVEYCNKQSVANVKFLPTQQKEILNDMLNAADICLVPQQGGASDLVLPSKLFNILAASRPLIVITPHQSELGTIVNESESGKIVEPGDYQQLVVEIERYLVNNEKITNGRKYLKDNFEITKVVEKFISEISLLIRIS